jgi:hypothetical protein
MHIDDTNISRWLESKGPTSSHMTVIMEIENKNLVL